MCSTGLAEFHATLAFRCLRLGWSSRDAATAARRGHTGSQRRWRFRACFVVAVFTLGTVNFGAQLAYVLDAFAGRGRAYAGGPAAFASATAAVPVSQISNVCCVLTVNLSDALLVSSTAIGSDALLTNMQLWRAFVIWQRVWGVMVLPGLLYGCVACEHHSCSQRDMTELFRPISILDLWNSSVRQRARPERCCMGHLWRVDYRA
jgi:hypothetical protein